MTYLQLDGILASTGPFYSEYKFQGRTGRSRRCSAGYDPRRAEFLRKVFGQRRSGPRPGRGHRRASGAAVTIGEPRERVVAAVNYLEEQGDSGAARSPASGTVTGC